MEKEAIKNKIRASLKSEEEEAKNDIIIEVDGTEFLYRPNSIEERLKKLELRINNIEKVIEDLK